MIRCASHGDNVPAVPCEIRDCFGCKQDFLSVSDRSYLLLMEDITGDDCKFRLHFLSLSAEGFEAPCGVLEPHVLPVPYRTFEIADMPVGRV